MNTDLSAIHNTRSRTNLVIGRHSHKRRVIIVIVRWAATLVGELAGLLKATD